MATVKERVKSAEELTELNPTDNQKISGNYKKGKVIIKGLKITIENPAGSIRRGRDKDGNPWENTMTYSYGYFNGTIGKDGDPIDVYLGPIIDQEFQVYVIDQLEESTRSFDEHKVMFGFSDADSAKEAYLSCFDEGWKGFGNIVPMSLSKFKLWLKNKEAIKRPASKMRKSSRVDYKNSTPGDRIKIIELEGEVLDGETLKDLQEQAGDPDSYDTLVVEIASPGGSVSEGLYIMVWLDSLSQQGKNIITAVTANAYSIASLIMLSANHRIISTHGKVMVHNPMVPELKYVNANELEKYTSELRALETVMYELYQIFTGLKPEQIKVLMDNETYLTPDEAVQYGFADIVVDLKPKPFVMVADNKTKKVNMSNTLNILHRVIGMVNQTDVVNQLYYDTKGGEVEIYQNDPSTYQTGDRTNIENGEVSLSDGSTLKIKDYVVESIDKAVEKVEEVVEEKPAAEFNEGASPEEPLTPAAEEVVEEIIEPAVEPAAEEVVKKKDEMPGRVIETTESVKSSVETIAQEKSEEDKKPEAIVEEEAPAVEAPEAVEEEVNPMKEVLDVLNKLSERISSIEEGMEASNAKLSNLDSFEQVATEAIDALAKNTVSNFQPKAKVKAVQDPTQGMSIFQRALAAKRAAAKK
jgi:ATP-dependent protease ClpP protease subunit